MPVDDRDDIGGSPFVIFHYRGHDAFGGLCYDVAQAYHIAVRRQMRDDLDAYYAKL